MNPQEIQFLKACISRMNYEQKSLILACFINNDNYLKDGELIPKYSGEAGNKFIESLHRYRKYHLDGLMSVRHGKPRECELFATQEIIDLLFKSNSMLKQAGIELNKSQLN